MEWEKLTKTTQRLKVYGGWVVSREVYTGHKWVTGASDSIALGMLFISDPKHKWRVLNEKI